MHNLAKQLFLVFFYYLDNEVPFRAIILILSSEIKRASDSPLLSMFASVCVCITDVCIQPSFF